MSESALIEEAIQVPVAALRLNPKNPRLPEGAPTDQASLRALIEAKYNPIAIARSIATHGYFSSEPLIVQKKGSTYLVLEGNRRLVALTLLASPNLARDRDLRPEWKALSTKAKKSGLLPNLIPAVPTTDPKKIDAILGYRHISGIQPWDPYNKSRFVAHLVEQSKSTFDEIALLVGERPGEVRSMYRNFAIVRQADRRRLDTRAVKAGFGVFTRAMGSVAVQRFIGAPPPKGVRAREDPIAKKNIAKLRRLFLYLYGGRDRSGRVIGESRDLSILADVLGSAEGRTVLQKTGDLDAAYEAIGGFEQRLLDRLATARKALTDAKVDIAKYGRSRAVRDQLDACQEALDRLVRTNARR